MTLQKKINPTTLSGVVGVYLDYLKKDGVIQVLGLAPTTIYQAADPDNDYVFSKIDYYVKLDKACVRLGYPAPFASWFMHQIGGEGRISDSIADTMLSLHSKTANLTETIRNSKCPNSPGGAGITPNEKADIFQAMTSVNNVMNDIKSTVEYSSGGDAYPIGKAAAE